jgi:hypothetical protein
MGHSWAHPVLRTTDGDTAFRQARRLAALLREPADEVTFAVDLLTVEGVRRMAEVLPQADDLLAAGVRTATDTALAALLPVHVYERAPAGHGLEERFVAARGHGTACVWWKGRWPDDPDAQEDGSRYDGVQLLFHGGRAQSCEPADRHTVFVTTGVPDLGRARKLAAFIGGEVLDEEGEPGW